MAEAWINIQNSSNVNGGTFTKGQDFYWANPVAGKTVTISGCGGFCTGTSYIVPGPATGQQYGLKKATLLAAPTDWSFSESPNEWNAPGSPHIVNPPFPIAAPEEKRDKEVA